MKQNRYFRVILETQQKRIILRKRGVKEAYQRWAQNLRAPVKTVSNTAHIDILPFDRRNGWTSYFQGYLHIIRKAQGPIVFCKAYRSRPTQKTLCSGAQKKGAEMKTTVWTRKDFDTEQLRSNGAKKLRFKVSRLEKKWKGTLDLR